jgi:hypothetical protein
MDKKQWIILGMGVILGFVISFVIFNSILEGCWEINRDWQDFYYQCDERYLENDNLLDSCINALDTITITKDYFKNESYYWRDRAFNCEVLK